MLDADVEDLRARLGAIDDPLTLLAGFFAHSPVGLQIYEASGRSILTNRAFRELFGSEPPPEYNVLRDEIAQKSGVLALIHRAFAGETIVLPPTWYDPRELEQVRVEKGNRVAIAATFFPLVDGKGNVRHVAIAFRDVTAETKAKDALESERARLAAILDHLPVGVLIARTCDKTFVYANAAATRLLGRDVVGQRQDAAARAFVMRHLDGRPCADDELPITLAMRGEIIRQRELVMRVGEREIPMETSVVPLRDAGGAVAEVIAIFEDISARKHAEAELRRLAAQKDEFLSVASHELRTPLTVIKASLQSSQRKLAPEREHAGVSAAVDLVGRALKQVDRMANLIAELLDASRIEAGRFDLDVAEHDLCAIVGSVVESARATSPTREVRLQGCDDALLARVDAARLEQVVTNLLTNALRYSPESAPVDVHIRRVDATATISVVDRGMGIAADESSRIFERFYRGPRASVERAGGLGLGLYIAHEIVRRHGGAIDVQSEVGRGSTFSVTLPLSTSSPPRT